MKPTLFDKLQFIFVISGVSLGVVLLVYQLYLGYIKGIVQKQPIELEQQELNEPSKASPSPLETISQDPQDDLNLDAYSLCQELDAINKAGKSVAGFIANSDNSSNYIEAATSMCIWHNQQAEEAVKIIEAKNTSPDGWFGNVENGIWNDCDGVKDPGETYSSACVNRQTAEKQQQNVPLWGGPNGLH